MNAFETSAKYESSPKIRNRLQNNCALTGQQHINRKMQVRAVAKLQRRKLLVNEYAYLLS